MFKRLLAFGDSFTFGYDLPDCDGITPSDSTYSAHCAKWLNIPYRCCAVGSNANQSITRNILETEITSDDLVIVMWTFEQRQDFLFDGQRGWSSITPQCDDDFSRMFYKNIDTALQYFQYLSHKEIFLVQQYLKQKNVQSINLSVTSSLIKSLEFRNTALTKMIDQSNWIKLPDSPGFYDWAVLNSMIVSGAPTGGHANLSAHQQLFEIIKNNLPG